MVKYVRKFKTDFSVIFRPLMSPALFNQGVDGLNITARQ